MDQETAEKLNAKAQEAHPNEACGFIMRDGSIIEVENISHDPERMFCMNREELIRRVDYAQVSAIWHTHPKGNLRPSKGDIDGIYQGMIHPSWKYIIVTKDGVLEMDSSQFTPKDDSFWSRF